MFYKLCISAIAFIISTTGLTFAQVTPELDTKIQSAAVRIRSQWENTVKAVTSMLGNMKLNKKFNTNQSTMSIVDGLLYRLHQWFFDQYFALIKKISPLEKEVQEYYNNNTDLEREQKEAQTKPLNDKIDGLRNEMWVLYQQYIETYPSQRRLQWDKQWRYTNALVDISWYFLAQTLPTIINVWSVQYKLDPYPIMQPYWYRDGLMEFDYYPSVPFVANWLSDELLDIFTNTEYNVSPYLTNKINLVSMGGEHTINMSYSLNLSVFPAGIDPSKLVIDERYLMIKNNDYGIKTSWPLSLEVSKKILKTYYMEEGWRLWYQDVPAYEKSVKTITADMIPVFGVHRLNEEYSLLYVYPPYAAEQPDGLGKPVIYSYDSLNRPNTVTVTLPQDAQFTYLKPLFNINQWRAYKSRDGKVIVDGTTYDYLRYKAAVNNYQINNRWRIIKWSEIADFYDKKLDQIGFNKKEKADFVEYRVPKYVADKTYFVSFKFNEQLDPYAKLEFSIQPDMISRILMETVELSDTNKSSYMSRKIDNNDLSRIQSIKRTGKHDIVERGGVFRAPNNQWVFGEVQ